MSKRDKGVPVQRKKQKKGVFANKKLRLSIRIALQISHPRHKSTQSEVRPNIDLERVKKNIEEGEWDFTPLPALSIQEKEELFVEVSDLPAEDVVRHLEKLIYDVIQSLEENKEFEFIMPSNNSRYAVYQHHLLRRVLTRHDIRRSSSGRREELFMSTYLVIWTIYEECFNDKVEYINKRAIYYIDPEQFNRNPTVAYGVIDDVCCMLRCTSVGLRVISDTNGKVIGPFTFVCGDTSNDCASSAKSIPSCELIADTSFHDCDALFILLAEKNTVFQNLAQAKFHENAKCIIVSGQGYGDRSTKVFLKKLYEELKLPVLAIVDCNPYGLEILFDYKYGSAKSSFDSFKLATRGISWLGVRPSDLEKYKIDEVEGQDLGDHAVTVAKKLLKQDFVKMDDKWVSEIERMLEIGKSIDIESLRLKGSRYLSMEFLQKKLESKDWI